MPTKKRAIIAGAGPAGLTAAYELLKRTDIEPIVYEASDAIGGIAQTYNYKGNRIDIGGHRFFSKSKRVMDWWFNILPLQGFPASDSEEQSHEIDYAVEAIMDYLGPECMPDKPDQALSWSQESNTKLTRSAPDPEQEDDVMLQRPRVSRILFRRNFFPYPIGITLRVAWKLGIFNTFLIACSYLWVQWFPLKDETYLDAFLINRFGRRLYKTFFRDYTEKVWGVPCSQIKADWGAQRIKGLSLKRALAHAIKDLLSSDFAKQQQERETSLITRFFYPKFGPGHMWETVASQVEQCGGSVQRKRRVVGVRHKQKRIVSVTVENVETGETEEVACDYFFSTMPVRHLIGSMHPDPPIVVSEVAEGLMYRDFLTVGLLLQKMHVQESGKGIEHSIPDNWIYVQDRDVHVGRVQVFNNWSPYMVEDRQNTVWIGLEYFVNEGDWLWVKPDADLIDLGVEELQQIGLIQKDDLLDACVLRMPKAYPAYFGSYDQFSVVREYVDTFENLYLLGRNGMHRYNNQDHSMLTAMLAVDNIVAGSSKKANLWNVNFEKEYHETKQKE